MAKDYYGKEMGGCREIVVFIFVMITIGPTLLFILGLLWQLFTS